MCNLGGIGAAQAFTITLNVTVHANAPTLNYKLGTPDDRDFPDCTQGTNPPNDTYDICNHAEVTAISTDTNLDNNKANEPTNVINPTASSLASFETVLQSSAVTQVSWMTALEDGIKTFNLYSASNAGDFASAVMVESFVPHGAFLPYTYTDIGIQPGTVKYYWLEAVYMDGSTKLYGPSAVGYLYKFYLPMSSYGLGGLYPYSGE